MTKIYSCTFGVLWAQVNVTCSTIVGFICSCNRSEKCSVSGHVFINCGPGRGVRVLGLGWWVM